MIAALFLIVGAALLGIVYVLVDHATARVLIARDIPTSTGQAQILKLSPSQALHTSATFLSGTGNLTARQRQQLEQLQQRALEVLHQHDQDLHQLLVSSGIALGVMAALAVGLGWVVAGRLLRPLRTMTATARQITEHNLHERLSIQGPHDEVKDLADTIDDLLARLETAFDAQRHFVANASHELRTPITLDRTLLEVALADPEASVESLRETCQDLLESSAHKEKLIESLLLLASSARGLEHRDPFDLGAVAGEVLQTRRSDAVRLEIQVDAELRAAKTTGNPVLVKHLVANLIDNALRYNHPGGRIEIRTYSAATQVFISVSNTGPPVPPDLIETLFRPFQRLGTDRTGEGHGLGLSVVRSVAEAHDATVTTAPDDSGGLRVVVSFPSSPPGSTNA